MGPRLLVLLDNDETSLYELELRLIRGLTACPFHTVVADVRDEAWVRSVFERYRPEVVFYSAALKHVPMMEYHPAEAVKNNVLGTRILAQASLEGGAEHFILISTDKAVHPMNVMGCTKRVAEMLIKDCRGRNGGKGALFTAMRFGNVLGSRGSVVPVFRKQMEEGVPVLITYPEVIRYFMTIEEAAQLVIQAGAFTRGKDAFILDMGKPVRIIDLARELIRLMGKEGKMEIKVTGLRSGEKLHETLTFPEEELAHTFHPNIDKALHDLVLPADFQTRMEGSSWPRSGGRGPRAGALFRAGPSYRPYVPRRRIWIEERRGVGARTGSRTVPGLEI
ncbi:MAG: polysaccharide biosynthesis protein [Actinomycetota bacterium]|nr:polysaccharide biosynthesis protein [Actinomycetota bacterium]